MELATTSEPCCAPETQRERDQRERAEILQARLRVVEAQAELMSTQLSHALRRAETAETTLEDARRRLRC